MPKLPWEWVAPAEYSAAGWTPKTLSGGYVAQVPTVGLLSFGFTRSHFTSGQNGYQPGATVQDIGTSFASPTVASLAVAFRQWSYTNNMPFKDFAWETNINLLTMGDGRCGYGTGLGNGAACSNVVSSQYGFGFPRYFVPNSTNLGAYGGWATHTNTITNGSVIEWDVGGPGNESNFVQGWKFALAVDVKADATDVNGVTNLPDLIVRVVNCSTGASIRTAARQGTRYLMQIRNPAEIQGKCLRVRVTGNSVRSGGETFWAVDYYYSNSTSQHLYVQ